MAQNRRSSETTQTPQGFPFGNVIQAVAIFVSAALGFAALVISIQSGNKVDATRVEIGRVITNSNSILNGNLNGSNYDNPWQPWVGPPGPYPRVKFVGVVRTIRFSKSFQNAPKVVVAYTGMDVVPFDVLMREIGYHPTAADEEMWLRDFHLASGVTDATPEGFALYAGIGLAPTVAEALIKYLQTTGVTDDTIKTARLYGQLDPKSKSGQLTAEETWMFNFYTTVGTLDLSWVARADQK